MNYRNEVRRTAGSPDLAMAALGLAGETGEVIDLIKKHLYHGKPLDRAKLINELGDVRWYFELLLDRMEITMEEVESANVTKLRARFPNGFSVDAANAKADEVLR